MTTITRDDVEVVATSVANRNPGVSHVADLKNRTCVYTYPDGSHCFVGAIVKGLGLPLPGRYDSVNGSAVNNLVQWLEARTGKRFSGSARTYLRNAQSVADQGYYWPDVVNRIS
jgi:hypothetical protein